jgi:hypothetical protein
MRNALIEQLARDRAAELTRAAEAARAARGDVGVRSGGLFASVRTLLARRRSAAESSTRQQPANESTPAPKARHHAGLETVRPD